MQVIYLVYLKMIIRKRHILLTLSILLLFVKIASAQIGGTGGTPTLSGGPTGGYNLPYADTSKKEAIPAGLEVRPHLWDSLRFFYRMYNAVDNRIYGLDSNISDYNKKYIIPWWYNTLGNSGTAAQSLVFTPNLNPGWDIGFHALDVYRYTLDNVKFYRTNKPFAQLAYTIASKGEQTVNILYTQNIGKYWNVAFDYRFLNAPGNLRNQNASNNNILITSSFITKNQKYQLQIVGISNILKSSENGGLRRASQLDSLIFGDPFALDVRLGNNTNAIRSPFNTGVSTGMLYQDNSIIIRHHYDIGSMDTNRLSPTDTILYHVFAPKFRFQHVLRSTTYSYQYLDTGPDSISYKTFFGATIPNIPGETISFQDRWNEIYNELSFFVFPTSKNPNQSIKVAMAYQNFSSITIIGTRQFYNAIASGEYRNHTRNNRWDMVAKGQFYIVGFNVGNYSAEANFTSFLGKRKSTFITLGFLNVNRSPSTIYDSITSFPIQQKYSFLNENTSRLTAIFAIPKYYFKIQANYWLLNNYMYFNNFYTAVQYTNLINWLHIYGEKRFRFTKHWNWYTEVHLQQLLNNAPINMPFLLTRNRIAFEGNFFRNLNLATGVEVIYNTPFKTDNYSPLLGQFFYQNNTIISNRPTVNVYLNFNIRSFTAYIQVQNLNTLTRSQGNIGFVALNQTSPNYYNSGLWVRAGIYWNFLN